MATQVLTWHTYEAFYQRILSPAVADIGTTKSYAVYHSEQTNYQLNSNYSEDDGAALDPCSAAGHWDQPKNDFLFLSHDGVQKSDDLGHHSVCRERRGLEEGERGRRPALRRFVLS